MNNYYQQCPPLMNLGRQFTDYRTPTRREQQTKYINGIVRDDDYRMFLQQNAVKILDNTWNSQKKQNACFPNECIHTYPTRVNPGLMYVEGQIYNAVRSGKKLDTVRCNVLDDYRAYTSE